MRFGYNPQIILSPFLSQSYLPWTVMMEKPFCLPWAVMASKAECFFFSTLDSYGRKKIGFCLLWKVIVGRGTVLSAIDSYVW